jgi:hypothetical protein
MNILKMQKAKGCYGPNSRIKEAQGEIIMQAIRLKKNIDETRELRIKVPKDFADTVEVIILPLRTSDLSEGIWDWDPDDIEFTKLQNKINLESIDKEYGAEDIKKWK